MVLLILLVRLQIMHSENKPGANIIPNFHWPRYNTKAAVQPGVHGLKACFRRSFTTEYHSKKKNNAKDIIT